MTTPISVKDKELRLDLIEFMILLKLKKKEYELKELTESIRKELGDVLKIQEEDIFQRLEVLRLNGFVNIEKRGLISKKNYFSLTDKGESKLREDVKLFEKEVVMFNRVYSTIFNLIGSTFPKMIEDTKRMVQNAVFSMSEMIKSATKPIQDAFFNTINQIAKSKEKAAEQEEQEG